MPKAKNKKKSLLSVIVPAYKKEKTIMADLEAIEKTLEDGLSADYDYEIICVVDGNLDRTASKAKKVRSAKIRVVEYEKNRGKGHAVRIGMKEAKGDYISFLDAGREISPKGITMLIAHLNWYNADIIVGSKRHPASRVNYPFVRKILSFGYHKLIKLMFGIPVSDTQSGIKIFKREVVEVILPQLTIDRYAMDIEMLAVAYRKGFRRIYEAPIEVHFDESTSSVNWSTVFKMFIDTLIVFYRLRLAHDYDKD